MQNTKTFLRKIPLSICSLALLISSLIPTEADSTVLELKSPKNNDHFEVTKPMFFWQNDPEAKNYTLTVDDTSIHMIPAVSLPVMHYGFTTDLASEQHQWRVKETRRDGTTIVSESRSFVVDPPGNWPAWAIGPFERYGANPILRPQGGTWESVNVLSPGVLFDQGLYRMLYRAQGRSWPSVEGYAESADGVTFTRNSKPMLDRTEPFEKNYGLEDARFLHYQNTYYAFYTGNNPTGGIALCEAISDNRIAWKKLGIIVDKTKNGGVVCDPYGTPVKINGKFAMYVGNSKFGVCYSNDLINWGPVTWFNMKFPKGWVAPYEPCIAIINYSNAQPDNIILFIAGTLNGKGKWFYGISEVLFSKADLTNKVGQLDDCIMKAQEPYESGQEIKSLWMNCIIQHDGQWMLYYAAGDRNVALATCPSNLP